MKKILSIILIFVLISSGIFVGIQFSNAPVSKYLSISGITQKNQFFVAHRGFSSICPENSLPAVKAAIENGYDAVEFDIHPTKDNKWILNHDIDIDHMTNGSGLISSYTYDELMQFNIDNGNNIKKYSNLKLPSLNETLDIISQSDIIPFIEIKSYKSELLQTLVDILNEYNIKDKTVIISFEFDALKTIREIDPSIELMYLTVEINNEIVDKCIQNGNIGINVFGKNALLAKDTINYAKENNLDIAAWTIDNPFMMDLLSLLGFKKFTTNRIKP